MKSRILSLLVALAVVLSLAVPAFAQTGETTENNNLPDVTDVTDEVETDEDLPEETEEDNPVEPAGSEENIDAVQNITDNDNSGSAEDNEENVQEEADAADSEQENDNSDDNEDDSEEESGSEDDNIDEADAESEDDEDAEEDENETEEDAENSDDELNSEESEVEEEDKIESEEEDNASKDDEEETDQEVENVNGEDEAEGSEDEHEEEIEATVENDAEEEEDESEDDETIEDSDNSAEFRLLTAEDLEDINLEDAEVVPVNSVVFMAAGAAKSEPIMAAPKSAPIKSGMCGDNLTWTLDEHYVLTISGTGNMYDYSITNSPWISFGRFVSSLKLGDGITGIGKYAFYDCDSEYLHRIKIPASVTVIGEYAFAGTDHVTEFVFEHSEDSELTIGQYAFKYNLDYNEEPHLVETSVCVPRANHINPAISGYDWKGSYRGATFKSTTSGGSGTSSGSGHSSGTGASSTSAQVIFTIFDENSIGKPQSSSGNLTQPIYTNGASPKEMIENWEKRNTFYDIVLETVLKNKTDEDEKYNLHNVAAALYKAADIDNAFDIAATAIDKKNNNGISTREQKKQDEMMLKLLKENFSMYLAEERLIEQQRQEAKFKEILATVATAGGMAQLGIKNQIRISQKASGMLQIAFGQVEIVCDSLTDAYNVCVMQTNYDRAMEYLENIQKNVDRNTS